MTMHELGDDTALLARLAAVAERLDPPPPPVLAAARGSFAWRGIDNELAELVYDSDLDAELVGARSAGSSRQLTFEAAGLTVEMEVLPDRRVVGQLVPPGPASIEFRHPAAHVRVDADHLGRFAAPSLPSGPVSLRCRADGSGPAVDTDWLLV